MAWLPGPPAKYIVRVAVVLLVVTSFAAGFKLSALFQARGKTSIAAGVPPTDFAIPLPEGLTRIVITDPQLDNVQVANLVIERRADSFRGLPAQEVRITPRSPLSAEDQTFFRHELDAAAISESPWQRANQIRDWLSTGNHKIALPGLATRTPRDEYVQMRQGQPVLCGNLAEIYVALCESAGLIARSVGLSLMVRDGTFGADTHAGAEIWIPEMGGWIYQDPTFNCYWTIDGRPASALQLHKALMSGREIQAVTADANSQKLVRNYYVDPRLLFRHISYEYHPGGPLLYYLDGRLEPLNLRDRNWFQSDQAAIFEGLDQNGISFVEHKGEAAPGIFVQLIGHVLFVRDRREQNRGIRVRSSSGTVQVCSYEHWRAEELGVFQGKNLVRNGSFAVSGASEGIAADWTVSGPVEVVTTLGGQGIAAQAGGKLSQRITVEPGKRYLLYAKLSVSRGVIAWSVSDAARGMQSAGIVRPAQMTEIVSDVVESRSGYLDLSFELPEAGGFRVMDVIVTELSSNAVQHMQKSIPVIASGD